MNNRTTKSLSWLIALVGLWHLISPWVLGYTAFTSALVNAVIFGALLIIFGVVAALVRSAGAARWLNWLNALIGIWLIIAPFALGFAALHRGAEVNSIIVGIVELVLGVIAAVMAGRYLRTHEMGREMNREMDRGTREMKRDTMAGAVPVTGEMDTTIRDKVLDRLVQDPKVDATGIDVRVNNGKVTLKGSVHSAAERQLAETDAQAVSGVRNVEDDLQVI